MIHQGQRLPFRLEAGNDLIGIHPRLDDFQSDDAADGSFLLGHIDNAKSPFADHLQQFVKPDHRSGPFGDRAIDLCFFVVHGEVSSQLVCAGLQRQLHTKSA